MESISSDDMSADVSADVSGERGYLGVEIGELAAWMTVTWGNTRPERQLRTRFLAPPSPDTFLLRLGEIVREVSGGDTINGVGVASWTPVNSEHGVIQASPLMPEWADISLVTRFRELLRAPVQLRTAVDAAALAEARNGAGQGANPIVYVHLGREVVSSVVYDGQPIMGAHGQAGRIGHWQVVDDGPRCACGAVGHLNPLCSSQGFVRLAIGLAAQDDMALAAVSKATSGRVESLTASRIVALADTGVEALRDLVQRSADALGFALAQLSLVVDPAVIVLGGPLGGAGGLFIEWTQERMAAELHMISAGGQAPRLISASLEPQSAITGAWLLGNQAANR